MQKRERVLQDDEQEVEDTMCLCLLTRSEVFVVWFVCCCRDPGDCLYRCAGVVIGSRKSSCQEWVAMFFKRSEGVRGLRGKKGPRKFWRMTSRLIAGVECLDELALQTMLQQHSSGSSGTYPQAVAARTGEWSTGSSTSSGDDDKKAKSQEAERKELRAETEHRRNQNGGDVQGRYGLPTRRESGMEERMESGC